jgi:hypothetical protein
MAEPSQALDNLTNTFTADRKFFDALMTQPCGEAFVEMCVWFLWLHEYLHDIQSSLHESGKTHGPHYQVYGTGDARSGGMLDPHHYFAISGTLRGQSFGHRH